MIKMIPEYIWRNTHLFGNSQVWGKWNNSGSVRELLPEAPRFYFCLPGSSVNLPDFGHLQYTRTIVEGKKTISDRKQPPSAMENIKATVIKIRK